MTNTPIMTPQLAARIERALNSLSIEGIRKAQEQPGNPYGIEIERLGSVICCLANKVKLSREVWGRSGWWNRVIGFQPHDLGRLDEILSFFRSRQVPCWLELNPQTFTTKVSEVLTDRGLLLSHLTTILYAGVSDVKAGVPDGIEVREVGPEEADLVAELWEKGFEHPPDEPSKTAREIRKGWFLVPDNHCYVGFVENTPAAMAALYIHEVVGVLNVAATLPAFRNRGVHTAMTHRRVADAARAGCELVIGHTGSFDSVSQNNMERAGLRTAYVQMTWVDREALTP